MANHNYKELKVWQKGMELARSVYGLTRKFPSDEKFGLIAQINRAAISIPSNIAEGAGRLSDKEFRVFLSYANGSACELETQLILSMELEYISKEQLEKNTYLIQEIQKMIFKLQRNFDPKKVY